MAFSWDLADLREINPGRYSRAPQVHKISQISIPEILRYTAMLYCSKRSYKCNNQCSMQQSRGNLHYGARSTSPCTLFFLQTNGWTWDDPPNRSNNIEPGWLQALCLSGIPSCAIFAAGS